MFPKSLLHSLKKYYAAEYQRNLDEQRVIVIRIVVVVEVTITIYVPYIVRIIDQSEPTSNKD